MPCAEGGRFGSGNSKGIPMNKFGKSLVLAGAVVLLGAPGAALAHGGWHGHFAHERVWRGEGGWRGPGWRGPGWRGPWGPVIYGPGPVVYGPPVYEGPAYEPPPPPRVVREVVYERPARPAHPIRVVHRRIVHRTLHHRAAVCAAPARHHA
jgi:hypothetical protein